MKKVMGSRLLPGFRLLPGLLAATAFQFLVLGGMVGVSAMPLWTGDEVRVKTQPVDPRSLFRGNYARLEYEFNRFDSGSLSDNNVGDEEIRKGTVIYVTLIPSGEDGLHKFHSWSLEKPNPNELVSTDRKLLVRKILRGRVSNRSCTGSCNLNVKFGIDAFFAPKEKAIALENELRDGGVAVLMVSKGGKARIKEVIGQ